MITQFCLHAFQLLNRAEWLKHSLHGRSCHNFKGSTSTKKICSFRKLANTQQKHFAHTTWKGLLQFLLKGSRKDAYEFSSALWLLPEEESQAWAAFSILQRAGLQVRASQTIFICQAEIIPISSFTAYRNVCSHNLKQEDMKNRKGFSWIVRSSAFSTSDTEHAWTETQLAQLWHWKRTQICFCCLTSHSRVTLHSARRIRHCSSNRKTKDSKPDALPGRLEYTNTYLYREQHSADP